MCCPFFAVFDQSPARKVRLGFVKFTKSIALVNLPKFICIQYFVDFECNSKLVLGMSFCLNYKTYSLKIK